MMARLNLYLTAVALVAVPVLLVSLKVFGGAMRSRGDGRPASGEQGLLAHPPGDHRPAADPEPRARAPRAAALHRSHRAGAAAQDGAAGSGGLLLGLDLGDPGGVHARRDLGRRARSPGREPDPGRAAGLPRVRRPALRAAPSALASGRDLVERERQHPAGVRDPGHARGCEGPPRSAPGPPGTRRRRTGWIAHVRRRHVRPRRCSRGAARSTAPDLRQRRLRRRLLRLRAVAAGAPPRQLQAPGGDVGRHHRAERRREDDAC